ncbi:MAG: hypothetical protein AAGB24_14440 [Bacteroidota bacterium]
MRIVAGMPILNQNARLNNSGTYPFGTLGGIVFDHSTNKTVGITAYHSVWTEGLQWNTFKNVDIAQKELLDVVTLNEPRNEKIKIGRILKVHFDNKIDTALIEFSEAFMDQIEYTPTESVHFSEMDTRDILEKKGASTFETKGEFLRYEENETIFYYGLKRVAFQLLIVMNPIGDFQRFSAKGDSGSIIYKEGKAAGLLLGGNNTVSYGMHAYFIEKKLNISF